MKVINELKIQLIKSPASTKKSVMNIIMGNKTNAIKNKFISFIVSLKWSHWLITTESSFQ